MPRIDRSDLDLILIEDTVWVLVGEVGLSSYDFNRAIECNDAQES